MGDGHCRRPALQLLVYILPYIMVPHWLFTLRHPTMALI